MRKIIALGLEKLLPRSSKTDPGVQYGAPYDIGRFLGRRAPIPLSRRPVGYNSLDLASHFGSPYSEGQSMQLCAESRKFVQGITSASLSQLLVWYLYHDLVPNPDGNRQRYLEMPRDEMVGWIRFGYELGHSTATSKSQHLPIRLQEAIEKLDLDARDVRRKLVRLGNMNEMQWHELASFDLRSGSSYLAAGDKLESDIRMLQNLRPISVTHWAKRQKDAIQWIQTYLAIVIRPAVDPEFYRRSASESSNSGLDKKEAARLFGTVCTYYADGPLQSLYHQATSKVHWNHANGVLRTREAMVQNHGRSWLPGTSAFNVRRRMHNLGGEMDDRRRSAPMLDRQENALLSMEEKLDVMQETMDAILDDRNMANSRSRQMLELEERGRLTRARNHIDANEIRHIRHGGGRSHDFDEESRYSDDLEGPRTRRHFHPSSAERPSTSLGYPARPHFAHYDDSSSIQPSDNEEVYDTGVHDRSKRNGMIFPDDYRPLRSHPPHLTEGKGKERERVDSANHPPRPAFSRFGGPRDTHIDRTAATRRKAAAAAARRNGAFGLEDAQCLVASGVIPTAPTPDGEGSGVPNVPERSAQRFADGETAAVQIVSPVEQVESPQPERQSNAVSPILTHDTQGTSGTKQEE